VNRTWLVTAFFFALLLLILYGAFLILTPFLTAITWAAILAILFYPVYAALLELMRGRATLAAMTVIVVITIIVIAPGVELARFLADEAVSLLSVGAFAPGRRWQAAMAGAAVGAALDRLVGYGDVPTGGFQDRLEEFVDSRGTIFVDVYRCTSQRDRSERAAFHG
jgi:hypothetical protein